MFMPREGEKLNTGSVLALYGSCTAAEPYFESEELSSALHVVPKSLPA